MTSRTSEQKSLFAETLGSYIEQSGYSVQRLSQVTGLGRSAIQHTISGKLIPAKAFVDRLSAALPLTPDQRTSLSELHARERAGDDAYFNRSNIRRIIECLPQYRIVKNDSSVTIKEEMNIDDSLRSYTGIVNTGIMLRSIIFRELQKDEPVIRTTIPFENTAFFSMALQIFSACPKKVYFEHFFRIAMCPEGAKNPNLPILSDALKTAVCPSLDYRPYYHYTDTLEGGNFMLPYPYYLITSEYSVFISKDIVSALATSSKDLLKTLSDHSDFMRSHSQLMIETVESCDLFRSYVDSVPYYTSSIDYQPFLTPYVTEDIFSRKLADIPDRSEFLEKTRKLFFSEKKTFPTKFRSYFTEKGLLDFTLTGVMKNIPGQLLTPMDKPDRLSFLKRMKADIKSFAMLDDDFHIPPFLQIICLTNGKVIVSCFLSEKKFVCVLEEHGVCSAFEDFVSSLSEMGLTYDTNLMEAVIDKCIEMLE